VSGGMMIFKRLLRLMKKYFIFRTINKVSLSKPLSSPHYLQIEPTVQCNLKCVFCSRLSEGKNRVGQDLTPDNMARILNLFPNLKYVSLQGLGETFLNKDLEEIMEKLKQNNIVSWALTNGTLLNKDRVRTLIHKYFFDIGISIDSVDQSKAGALRPGGPDINQVIQGVTTLIKERDEGASNIFVGFNVTVSHENYHELPKIGELAAKLGVDYILLNNIENWFTSCEDGYGQAKEFSDIANTKVEQIDNAVKKLKRGVRFSPVVVRHSSFSKRIGDCMWPFSSMFIAADGSVTPCCVRMHTNSYSMGNIHDCKEISEIWHGKQYTELRQAHTKRDEGNIMCGLCPK
jgi:radical SAM protein with 4Fe4S-binding SPASM domain